MIRAGAGRAQRDAIYRWHPFDEGSKPSLAAATLSSTRGSRSPTSPARGSSSTSASRSTATSASPAASAPYADTGEGIARLPQHLPRPPRRRGPLLRLRRVLHARAQPVASSLIWNCVACGGLLQSSQGAGVREQAGCLREDDQRSSGAASGRLQDPPRFHFKPQGRGVSSADLRTVPHCPERAPAGSLLLCMTTYHAPRPSAFRWGRSSSARAARRDGLGSRSRPRTAPVGSLGISHSPSGTTPVSRSRSPTSRSQTDRLAGLQAAREALAGLAPVDAPASRHRAGLRAGRRPASPSAAAPPGPHVRESCRF